CDGTADNGFNKQTNPNHCGSCNNVCSFPNAIAGCSAGACTIAACEAGYGNPNGIVADGCERACEVWPVGVEVCDGKDNDCDGLTDEGLTAPPGLTCVQTGPCLGAVPACAGALGWRCNYQVLDARIEVQPNGTLAITETRCDGFDNNCNTQSDETFPTLGAACDDGGVGVCRDVGVIACDPGNDGATICDLAAPPDAVAPGPEQCNGLDDDCNGSTDDAIAWDMVHVTGGGYDFWVDRYEASRIDATATESGAGAPLACTTGGVLPWTSATWAAAKAACEARGGSHRLCTAAELAYACAGSAGRTYPYGSTYAPLTCNGADYDGIPGGTDDDVLVAAGARAACQTPTTQIHDLSGNVTEWTSTQTGSVPGSPPTPIYQLHGGSYLSPAGGLMCTIGLAPRAAANAVLENVGFRCCRN
ncbi:MAG: SUMF1/EgtB/PvdO family nonheme iron enzyme, partial [Polyangiaceae bacterium]|nr:SUMF1/EgtB/PvdO family nonheme iron enzyme [Polyangiaceae bacterium]